MRRVKSITTKYTFLGLIALGLIASFISLSFWFTNRIKGDAKRINLAGKQRMLSYEMSWLLIPPRSLKEPGEERAKPLNYLEEEMTIFEEVLYAVRDGSKKYKLAPLTQRDFIVMPNREKALDEINSLIEEWQSVMKPTLAKAVEGVPGAFRDYNIIIHGFVDKIDTFVSHLEKNYKKEFILYGRIRLAVMALSVFVFIALVFFARKTLVVPILKLRDAAGEFEKGNLDVRVESESRDEIGALANAFNKMGTELKKSYSALKDEITNRKFAEEKIQDSEERFHSVANTAKDAIVSIDSNGEIIFWNTAAENIFGYSADEAVGKLITLVLPREFHDAHQKGFDRIIKTGESKIIGKTVEVAGLRKDGRAFPIEISLSTWKVKAGVFFTAIIRDITERKKLEKKLRTLSLSDELTGLSNRRGFFSLVEHLLKLAKRQKQGMYLLYADLDDLKWLNDTFGHNEGDRALKDIANILKANYRESDIVARIAGDEFAVIPVGTAGDSVEVIISSLQEKLDDHNKKRNRRYRLSLSVGIAYYDPGKPCSIDELLAQADKMMYEQKKHKHGQES